MGHFAKVCRSRNKIKYLEVEQQQQSQQQQEKETNGIVPYPNKPNQ